MKMQKPKKKEYPDSKSYNEEKLKKILELCDSDLPKAIEEFSEYLDTYPEDYGAYCYYASSLITLRKFEEAEQILNDAERRFDENYTKHQKERIGDIFLSRLHFTRMKLLCYQEKYQECIDYYSKNKNMIYKNAHMREKVEYCKARIGLPVDLPTNKEENYFFKQMTDYNYEEFKKHIRKHFPGYKANGYERVYGKFLEEFPLDEVLEEVKKYIPNEERGYCFGFYEDCYYFKYDDCGKSVIEKERNYMKDKDLFNYKKRLIVTDYFVVNTFHNTSNLITL